MKTSHYEIDQNVSSTTFRVISLSRITPLMTLKKKIKMSCLAGLQQQCTILLFSPLLKAKRIEYKQSESSPNVLRRLVSKSSDELRPSHARLRLIRTTLCAHCANLIN